ncbi:uncharacterized protein METZ01_LOCUS41882, partial [marine metagenome]
MDEPEHHCCHGEGSTEVESGGKGKVDVPPSVPAWVCPMCPSVRELGPGACPMCGMALESEEVAGVAICYTCPMHADVQKEKPGSCPICGMALEPMTVVLEADNPELDNMRRRFYVSLVFTVP